MLFLNIAILRCKYCDFEYKLKVRVFLRKIITLFLKIVILHVADIRASGTRQRTERHEGLALERERPLVKAIVFFLVWARVQFFEGTIFQAWWRGYNFRAEGTIFSRIFLRWLLFPTWSFTMALTLYGLPEEACFHFATSSLFAAGICAPDCRKWPAPTFRSDQTTCRYFHVSYQYRVK